MNEQPSHKRHHNERSLAPANRPFDERRWERRIHYVLWALAAVCLVLAALFWQRLLSGVP